jgi:hypothetical protein
MDCHVRLLYAVASLPRLLLLEDFNMSLVAAHLFDGRDQGLAISVNGWAGHHNSGALYCVTR